MKKLKLIRDYGKFKKDEVVELGEKESYFLLINSIAVVVDCGKDCEECEDCKSTKKKRAPKKSVSKKSTPAK